jgi:GH25 family lysozyme M1 (1,4-beta-N-acetylmuramidase)
MDFNPVVIDLSHHNNVQNWDAVKNFGILGVINKATEDDNYVDKTLAIREAPVRARGLLYGAYHFLRPGDPVAQADFFLDTVATLKNPDDMLLALDHEDSDVPLDDAKAFLARIREKAGRSAVLYSGHLIKEQLGDTADEFLASHRLWLSHYSANPVWPANWAAPWLIQFTGDGVGPTPHNVPGIVAGNAGLDIDHYGGTAEQLKAEWVNGVATG